MICCIKLHSFIKQLPPLPAVRKLSGCLIIVSLTHNNFKITDRWWKTGARILQVYVLDFLYVTLCRWGQTGQDLPAVSSVSGCSPQSSGEPSPEALSPHSPTRPVQALSAADAGNPARRCRTRWLPAAPGRSATDQQHPYPSTSIYLLSPSCSDLVWPAVSPPTISAGLRTFKTYEALCRAKRVFLGVVLRDPPAESHLVNHLTDLNWAHKPARVREWDQLSFEAHRNRWELGSSAEYWSQGKWQIGSGCSQLPVRVEPSMPQYQKWDNPRELCQILVLWSLFCSGSSRWCVHTDLLSPGEVTKLRPSTLTLPTTLLRVTSPTSTLSFLVLTFRIKHCEVFGVFLSLWRFHFNKSILYQTYIIIITVSTVSKGKREKINESITVCQNVQKGACRVLEKGVIDSTVSEWRQEISVETKRKCPWSKA